MDPCSTERCHDEKVATPACNPQNNGMAKRFVKTMTRDYMLLCRSPMTTLRPLTWPCPSSTTTKRIRITLKYRPPKEGILLRPFFNVG